MDSDGRSGDFALPVASFRAVTVGDRGLHTLITSPATSTTASVRMPVTAQLNQG